MRNGSDIEVIKVTHDDVADPQNLPMWLTVNGKKMLNCAMSGLAVMD